MVDSVIHSAVMAACSGSHPAFVPIWWRLTQASFIYGDVADPVELLMKVQLGGGTNTPVPWSMVGNLLNNQQKASLSS
ncbi:hypothetical protein ACNKHP_21965 [Shigella boydii]